MLGLWSIIKACLLMANAGAVLHETRLLPQIGIPHVGASAPAVGFDQQEGSSVPMKVAGLLNAVRYMRWPLVFINLLAIFFEIIVG